MQTFVLAQQPTGYFVLNDIFRYINEEVDEEVEAGAGEEDAAQQTSHEQLGEGVEMPKAQPGVEDPKQVDLDADVVDMKLEESLETTPAIVDDTPATNGNDANAPTEVDHAEEAPVAVTKPVEEVPTPETVKKILDEEDTVEAEKPKDPLPSPVVSRVPSTTKPAPTQPAVPAKPMSWANRAAAAVVASTPRPAVPQPKAVSPAPTSVRAPPAAQAAQGARTPPTTTPTTQAPSVALSNKENEGAQQSQSSGWQTAGSDHAKRQNRPQSVSGPMEKEGTMGYVRNVTEGVKDEELKAALSSYGELVYFDINRQKV